MNPGRETQAAREIAHGRTLARDDPERTWGWATPAGRRRARRRAELVASAAALGPGKRVLEVGCGTGLFTEYFAATGAHIVAVDISPELVAKARARGLPADRVALIAKPFEECAHDGPFDAVVGNSILHHLAVEDALRHMVRLLRPGGLLSFAEPNLLNPQIFVQKTIPWIKRLAGDSPDETAFIRWQLARRLRGAGFDEIRIVPFDWLHPATPERLIGFIEQAGRWLEAVPVFREFSGSVIIRARRPVASAT
jgi:2-polyprenyl-3-methyl-5-hydroxy-6-metoxy-1,4-benzoquinol methylase